MNQNPFSNGVAVSAALKTTLAIELFLNESYLFRRNVLNGKVEFATKPEANVPPDEADNKTPDDSLDWRPLTQEVLNSIIRKAKKEGLCSGGSSPLCLVCRYDEQSPSADGSHG